MKAKDLDFRNIGYVICVCVFFVAFLALLVTDGRLKVETITFLILFELLGIATILYGLKEG